MTLTFQNLPRSLTETLKRRASAEGRTVADVALEAMSKGLNPEQPGAPMRDLSDVVGTWVDDPAFDEAMKDFEHVEPDAWK